MEPHYQPPQLNKPTSYREYRRLKEEAEKKRREFEERIRKEEEERMRAEELARSEAEAKNKIVEENERCSQQLCYL